MEGAHIASGRAGIETSSQFELETQGLNGYPM